MHDHESECPNVQSRLELLEAASRRLRVWSAVLAIATVVLTGEALRQAGGRAKRLVAEEFVVKGKDGVMRGHFGLRPDGLPEMAIYDEKGELKVALHMYCDKGAALIFNDGGDTRIHLESPGDGSAAMRFRDKSGRGSSTLFLSEEGTSGLSFDHEQSSVLLGLKPNTQTGMVVTDAEGREQGRIGSPGLNARTMGIRPVAPQEQAGMPTAEVSHQVTEAKAVDTDSPPPRWGMTSGNAAAGRSVTGENG